jgi:CHAT domain
MSAGASRVVSNIWNIDDRAGAELVKRFCAALRTRRRPRFAARSSHCCRPRVSPARTTGPPSAPSAS